MFPPCPHPPAHLLALLAAACGAAAPGPPRPNLLLVSVDCLRADHVGCYGYDRATTPHIDALAAAGVRFERCLSTSSWTLPAHLSMLTGLPVSAHGVDDDRHWGRTDDRGNPIPPPLRGTFVAETLSRAGYRTAGFHTWKYLEPQFGFGPGFGIWERLGHTFYSHPVVGPEWERLRAANDEAGMKALYEAHPDLFDAARPGAPETVDRAIGWLGSERGGAPFFLFVHLFDVHDPYHPPEPFRSRFDPDYEGPIDGHNVTSADSPVRGDMPARDLEHLIALYDGALAFVDQEIGRLLASLEALGLAEDTLVVVTADHGEEFFDHGHKTHRRQLYLESVAVPLVMRWPAGLPAGRTVEGNVGLVDLVPTLCSAAGIEPGAPTPGIDLLPLARGEEPNGARTYLSELVLFDGQGAPARHISLIRGDEQRLLTARGESGWIGERFDLAANPLGAGPGTPLEPDPAFEAELARLRRSLRELRDAQPGREPGDFAPLGERDRADLAAMGYGGAGEPVEGDGERPDRLSIDGGVWPDR